MLQFGVLRSVIIISRPVRFLDKWLLRFYVLPFCHSACNAQMDGGGGGQCSQVGGVLFIGLGKTLQDKV